MKKIGLGILIGLFILVISGVVVAQPKGVSGRYFIGSNSGILKVLTGVQHDFENGYTAELSSGQLKALEKLTSVLGVEIEEVPLYHVSAKPTCDYDGECEPGENPSCADCKNGDEEPPAERSCYPSDQTPWGIKKVNGGSGGADVVDVAVLDTGVYKDHLDLVNRVKQCKDFTRGPRVKNGCTDGYGHGTHVAGTILADGGLDGLGIYGVAPEAKLFAYKVCGNDGSCWTDDIAAAINYAGSNGAEIVSMSLGGDTQSSLIKAAIDDNPHILFVAAAGNDRKDGVGSIDYPGAYEKVIAVAAFDSLDAMADFSSLGENDNDWIIEEKEIEFAAPGVSVESTYNNGCYAYGDGTSMATPHVAGMAARDWQGSASATRAYLQGLAKDYTENILDYGQTGDDIEAGFGLPIAP